MGVDGVHGVPLGERLPETHRWPVVLREGPVILRPLRARDEPVWDALRAANYLWTHQWDATMPPEGQTQPLPFRTWVRRASRQAKRDALLPFGLAYDAGRPGAGTPASRARLIGQVTVSSIVQGSARSAAIGYWIDQGHAGRGIVPTAVALTCDYLWQVMRLHRIEICIRPENAASLRVVEKLGFREEGLRPRYLHINGEWRDHRVFALNAEEVPGGLRRRLLTGRGLPGAAPTSVELD